MLNASTSGAKTTQPDGEPLVHVIVLTYNGKRHLEHCLPALARTRYSNYQTIVVDNGSADGSPEFVEAHFPQCHVLRNHANLGFAGGNNSAIRRSLEEQAEFVVLLNDDADVLDPAWLRSAVAVAKQDKSIAMIGFDIVDGSGEYKPHLATPRTPSELSTSIVKRIDGCALFIRSRVLVEIGLLDEIYFMYAEEDDLELRALRAGYTLVAINSAVYHVGGATSKQYPAEIAYYEARNYLRFAIKNLNLGRILRRVVTLFDILCNPYPLVYSAVNPVHVRMRSASPLASNLWLYARAVFWNLAHLSETLRLRFQQPARGHQE